MRRDGSTTRGGTSDFGGPCAMMSSMSDATLDVPALRQILRRYSAIASLEDHVLAPLAAGAERLEVPRRRAIFTREQVGPGLLFVVEGSLKICLFSPEGREQLLYLADPGMMIAEGLSLDGRPCRASAFALDDAVVWRLSSELLTEVAMAGPGLGMALARLVAKRADRWIDRCHDLPLRTVDQRLARFLLELAPPDEAVVTYVIARERDVATIAALLGSVREEVTRAQRRLQEAGIIEVNRREVRVLDRAALADLLLD